jgi:pantothenate kinase
MASSDSKSGAGLISSTLLGNETRICLDMAAKIEGPGRLLVGIAGPPGVGKSTVAEALRDTINQASGATMAAIVPMDGFHLLNEVLAQRGLRDRKGAPETFDTEGFAALLTRVKAGEAPLPVPIYARGLGHPIPGGIILSAENRIALVEGNYLYLKSGAWGGLSALFDRRLFLNADREECRRRLVPRHIASGKTDEHARRHVETVDLRNYDLILKDLNPAEVVIYDNGGQTEATP